MSAIFRLIYSLLQQPWFVRAATVVAVLLIAVAILGWRLHWPRYPTFLEWGLVWGVLATGAWILNR